ncbi:histidine N-alpha-methyltransferase [Podospora australis]|uniref:4-dimethylallyltryptophan N-methyltransferase n=1 Tax=Podospora australis TaxID=1536484 RepID=A0AAN6WPE5_9PEZI|nr:histidine N-alpha-methyltransferase [Podospora australis]
MIRPCAETTSTTQKQQSVLPSALLSSDEGSFLWREITRLPNYYQTRDEISLLTTHGAEIASLVPPNSILIDIGCGDTRKVEPLLTHLSTALLESSPSSKVTYFGLDLSQPALASSLSSLPPYPNIEVIGLWGTFTDGLSWLSSSTGTTINPSRPKWFLSLGSILGNDFPAPAMKLLSSWASIMRPGVDRMLLGMDGTTDPTIIWESYHDAETASVFEKFMRLGLSHSNTILGVEWYKPEDWEVVGKMSTDYVMHQFVFRALVDVNFRIPAGYHNVRFPRGHEIDCYEAFKFGPQDMVEQFRAVGLRQESIWKAPGDSCICKFTLLTS